MHWTYWLATSREKQSSCDSRSGCFCEYLPQVFFFPVHDCKCVCVSVNTQFLCECMDTSLCEGWWSSERLLPEQLALALPRWLCPWQLCGAK